MNQQILKGKWNEFKGELRKTWGDISDNELEQTKGNVHAIGGLLQQKYGHLKDDVRSGFDQLVKRFGEEANSETEKVKNDLRQDEREDERKDH